eukprot:m.133240 g.133240  ORF g.133240 m.133240 type:complete len:409 (-) comp11352_c0_seq3:241-1467(-)
MASRVLKLLIAGVCTLVLAQLFQPASRMSSVTPSRPAPAPAPPPRTHGASDKIVVGMHTSTPRQVRHVDCQTWNCSCQGFSDVFDTWPYHWGSATPEAKKFWMDKKCDTYPASVTHPEAHKNDKSDEILRIDPDYLVHLRSLDPIPKHIHLIWPAKDVIEANTDDPMIRHGAGALKRLNPDWTVHVWNYTDMFAAIQAADPSLIDAAAKKILMNAHTIERTDAFRMLIMYTMGGLYQDMDRAYSRPLSQVIHPQTRMLIPTYFDSNIMQDLMSSAARNRVFKRALLDQNAIRKQLKRVDGWASNSGIMKMGPACWNKAIAGELFGASLKHEWGNQPGKERVKRARELMEKESPLIVTAREQWCNGLLVENFDGCKRLSRDKLYKKYLNGVHWAKAAKDRWKAHGVEPE